MYISYTKKTALGTEDSAMMKMSLLLRSFLSSERDRHVHKVFSHIKGTITESPLKAIWEQTHRSKCFFLSGKMREDLIE